MRIAELLPIKLKSRQIANIDCLELSIRLLNRDIDTFSVTTFVRETMEKTHARETLEAPSL